MWRLRLSAVAEPGLAAEPEPEAGLESVAGLLAVPAELVAGAAALVELVEWLARSEAATDHLADE